MAKKQCSITIDSKLRDEVVKKGKEESRNFSNMIEKIIKDYLDKENE